MIFFTKFYFKCGRRENVFYMKKRSSLDIIYSITSQLAIIVSLFVWLFAIAPFSYYSQTWTDDVVRFVHICNIINPIVFLILLSITFFCAFKLKKLGRPGMTAICSLIIFVVHIVIRINMLGTYQWSDASLYYSSIEKFAYYPNGLLDNFIKNGFVLAHIGHGFIFVTMLGQLLNVPNAMGFQYSYMVMGAAAAVCLFHIFKVIFPKKKDYICAIAAFVVSVHPIFLGLSTTIHMEYPLAVMFIYVLCAYLTGKYILMLFWLVMLGTCKETGAMMAFSMLFFIVVYETVSYIKKNGGMKSTLKKLKPGHYIVFGVFIAACVAAFVKIINIPMWGGVRIIDVLKVGGQDTMNFQFEREHFMMKVRQLFILNFSWLWAVILFVCIIAYIAVSSVRKRKGMNVRAFSFVLIQYFVYTFFLLFFLEAKQTRYNILSDTLFLFITMVMVIRVLDGKREYICVSAVIGLLAFVETYLTIDPVSLAVFTRVNTGRVPMVWTASTRDKFEYMDINVGDFGYYNYQYTSMDRAVDKMLDRVDYQGWYRITSSFVELTEDQFSSENLLWDSVHRIRTYRKPDGEVNLHAIQRLHYTEEIVYLDHRSIYVEIPWCRNHTEEALAALGEGYDIDGPYTTSGGLGCSLSYYVLYRK